MPPRKVQLTSNWPERPVLEADEGEAGVLGVDRVDEGVGRGQDLDRPDALADEAADDLDAVAAHVDDRPAAGDRLVPEPGAVRAGMGLARADPENAAQGAGPDGIRAP